MLIQPLLFPPEYLKNGPELFFQGIEAKNITESSVSLPAGAELSMGTYFNSFSIGKWCKYTKLNNLSLHLNVQGRVEIEAYHAIGTVDTDFYVREQGKHSVSKLIQLVNEKAYSAKRETADYFIVQKDDEIIIQFKNFYDEGILYVTVKAITDVTFLGGYYATEIDEPQVNPVKLALGICTYNKEEFVTGNVKRVIKEIINNPSSPLKDKLAVYIADNGQTLDDRLFSSDKIHIFPNPNLGGVGGFTRTMLEAMFYDKAKDFTHIIFMDDDIQLYPAVLERTYYLLQLLKPEYQKAILGAGNLLLESPNIQQETGALYKDVTMYIGRANHKFFDLNKTDAVAANEVINHTNYTGWWYACIPKTIVNEFNLPMPFFIHYDDAEYGIRNIDNGLLLINGICAWHPSPIGKNPFWMTYYDVRNRLVTMFSKNLSKENFYEYLIRLSKRFILKAVRYEYTDAKLMLNALSDFLEGPETFATVDGLKLHSELLKNKDILFSPEEAGVSPADIVEKKYPGFKKAVVMQIICNLLPAKKRICAVNTKYFNIPYNANKIYLYNEKIGKGTLTERNSKEFFRLLFSFLKVRQELKNKYKKLLQDWQTAKPRFTSIAFWEKYLGFKNED